MWYCVWFDHQQTSNYICIEMALGRGRPIDSHKCLCLQMMTTDSENADICKQLGYQKIWSVNVSPEVYVTVTLCEDWIRRPTSRSDRRRLTNERLLMMIDVDDDWWTMIKLSDNATKILFFLFSSILFTLNRNSEPEALFKLNTLSLTQPLSAPNQHTHWLTGSLSLYTIGAAVCRSYIYLGGSAQTLNYMGAKAFKTEICS